MGNMQFEQMESITDFFSSLTLKEKIPKLLEIKEDLYEYEGTITNLMKPAKKPSKIYFKAYSKKCFWCPSDMKLSEDIQIGTYVRIKYKEALVKTYSHFWIKSIVAIDINEEKTLRDRKNLTKPEEKSPSVKCFDCGNLCELSNFKQCEGVLGKTIWQSSPHCDKCNSINEDGYIGSECVRETTTCDSCKSSRKI